MTRLSAKVVTDAPSEHVDSDDDSDSRPTPRERNERSSPLLAQRAPRRRSGRRLALAAPGVALRGLRSVFEPPLAAGQRQETVSANACLAITVSAATDPEPTRRARWRDRSGAPVPAVEFRGCPRR